MTNELASTSPLRKTRASFQEVPNIITAAGKEAVELYRDYFEQGSWSAVTRKAYRMHARRFFRWAEEQGLRLDSVSRENLADYASYLSGSMCPDAVSISLTPMRGLFRRWVASGVFKENPFRGLTVTPGRKGHQRCGDEGRFPLLSVMTMLAHTEDQSRDMVFADECAARKLLEFVRWPEVRECTHCGASENLRADETGNPREFQCQACGRTYAVTDGSPFEGLIIPLHQGLSLLFHLYLDDGDDSVAHATLSDSGIDDAVARQLAARIDEALALESLAPGKALRQAFDRRNREMVNDLICRNIKRIAELQALREHLLKAKADGIPIAELPPEMTFDEAIGILDTRIAEIDDHKITVEDGLLAYYFPETTEPVAPQQDAVPGFADHGTLDEQ